MTKIPQFCDLIFNCSEAIYSVNKMPLSLTKYLLLLFIEHDIFYKTGI